MMRTTRTRAAALLGVTALLLTACGGDNTEADPTDAQTTEAGDATSEPADETPEAEDDGNETAAGGGADGVLTIGTILPASGSLAFLGPPEFAGAELAVQRMNDAGGVLGEEVVLMQGDSGDTSTDTANTTVDGHLAEGADAIVGAASSAVSFNVIDKITGANVIHFSPANTSPDFTTYDDNGLYFRTAPSDVLQGKVLSDLVIENAGANVVVINRQEPYGDGLAQYTTEPLQEAGVNVTNISYDPNATEFAAEVTEIANVAPDNVVIIGFDETEQIIKEMIAQGIGPDATTIWLVDGNVGDALGQKFDDAQGVLEGIRGTLPAAETGEDFREALLSVDPDLEDFSYGPETYDAVTIIGLAAEVAGTDDPVAVAAEINGVTKEGEKCTDFASCKELIADGTDIDYDGAGGPYSFAEAGEPTEASFAILQYGADNRIDDSATEYRFAAIED